MPNLRFNKPFKFKHSPEGLNSLVSILLDMKQLSSITPKVLLEATRNYSKPIVSYFINQGYNVIVINPIQTHNLKKKTIQKVKTDPVDTNKIAKVYLFK